MALVKRCPKDEVEPWVWDALRLARLAKRGEWPVPGGSMRQTRAFLSLAATAWAEEAAVRADLKLDPE